MSKPDNTLPLDAYQRLLAQQEENNRRARPRHQESTLQKTCVAWFRAQYPDHALMLFAVPNGGGRSRTEAAIMKAEGVTAGVADLILLESRGGYGSLCIEMKTCDKSSRQSASQKAWQNAAEDAGNKYVVVRSFDEFRALMYEYMDLPRTSIALNKIKFFNGNVDVKIGDFHLTGRVLPPELDLDDLHGKIEPEHL